MIVILFLNDCKSSPRHFWISPWHPWSPPQDLLLSFHSHRLQSWVVHFFAILKSLQSNQLTLIWKTFHGLVHPSQLGLQHGNLKIFKLLQRNNRCCVNALMLTIIVKRRRITTRTIVAENLSNLSITPGCSLLCSVLVVLSQNLVGQLWFCCCWYW